MSPASIVILKIYRTAALGGPADSPRADLDFSAAHLLKVLAMEYQGARLLGREQAARLLGQALPELGRIWYVQPHPHGWIKCIRYQDAAAWALLEHPSRFGQRLAGGRTVTKKSRQPIDWKE